MAPALPELFSQAAYSVKTYDWSSSVVDASEKLSQTAAESNILSAIWTWILSVFTPLGAFFVSSWQVMEGGEVTKEHVWEWIVGAWQDFSQFLLRPEVRNALIVWFIVFWVCALIPLASGFGSKGVIAGSIAAWFQSVVYGAFTPAGGFFAIMTSVGMLGIAHPHIFVPSTIIASLAAWIAWSKTVGA
ncbi:unnamed protein product [Rhizoctonia solani]|uniref:Uncharacterized protein n=1 Tax=Rhizoctonia solani TaxID=456999 RepID=A0A8H2ZUB5_9AGAM|nr:unnamed protein product [Rhizoctonia solani]